MIRANAPKLSGMYAHDCALCGHEELKRTVWLTEAGTNNPRPYGTGCAAKLLGETETALLAALAAEDIAGDPRLEDLQGWFNITRPGRYTPKFEAQTAKRYRYEAHVVEHAYRCWQAIRRAA